MRPHPAQCFAIAPYGLANALAGGLGMASALNVGETHAAANAGHGSAPDIAVTGLANPTGLILSAAALLGHLGTRPGAEAYAAAGQAIERAVDAALARPEGRTGNLGGTAKTIDAANAICRHLHDT